MVDWVDEGRTRCPDPHRHRHRRDDPSAHCGAVSVFVDDVGAAHAAAVDAGLEIVHPLSSEEWGVTRFFYRDTSGRVVNVGMHT